MTRLGDRIQVGINDWILGGRFDRIRDEVVRSATGRVLEIGAGTGLNFSRYAPGTEVIAIEPSQALRARADERRSSPDVRATVVVQDAFAESLPFDAGSFDAVVVTFVLCSIRDPQAALREIRRVLRPSGALHVAEHVLSPEPPTATWQHRLEPLWIRVFGGCSLVRDSTLEIERAGFDVSGIARTELPLPRIARAGIAGRAARG